MLGETAGSKRRLRLKGVVTKIKCNDIHLQVSPRAEHSRKTFHKDLKILVSQGFRSKAARSFVMSPHCVIYLLESRSPQGPPQTSGLTHFVLFIFLYLPDFSQVLSIKGKEKKKQQQHYFPLREQAWHLVINCLFFHHFQTVSSVYSRKIRKEARLTGTRVQS